MTTTTIDETTTTNNNDKQLNDANSNLYNAIKLHRNDIVVSLINEWFKTNNNSDHKYFFNNFYENKTALHLAFELNDYDILRTLLNFNANPNIKDKINNKTLTELINSSRNQTMKQILNDSLLQSIAQNNLTQIQQFIDSGINLNSTDGIIENNSYLHWASLYSNESVVKLLLDNGSNVNIVNKFGSTPLHDAVFKRKDLTIVEILLFYKADVNLKATDGVYKNKSSLELSESNNEIHSFIIEFMNESEPPMSPNSTEKLIKHADYLPEHFEIYSNYCVEQVTSNDNMFSLLWPKPQILKLSNSNQRFYIPVDKKYFVYVKPPNTYKYIDFINRLTSVYSDIKFVYVNKEINEPYIVINIDENLFNIENSYSILIKKNIISIDAYDLAGLQYALCTFLQLCKIYANLNIPEMKIIDYPDIKNRGVLIDLSQGFYLKYTYLLSLIQTLTFFKLNQIHFYVKFSTQSQEKKQWYHCLE
jgi:ankyrin repeat protein